MSFSIQVIYKGRGWKEGEIVAFHPDGHVYLEHESKKAWKENGSIGEFNDNFSIIYITDIGLLLTDKSVYGYIAPYELLSRQTANLRRYKINMSDSKQLYKDLKKDGTMDVLWSDIVGDIVDQKGAI